MIFVIAMIVGRRHGILSKDKICRIPINENRVSGYECESLSSTIFTLIAINVYLTIIITYYLIFYNNKRILCLISNIDKITKCTHLSIIY